MNYRGVLQYREKIRGRKLREIGLVDIQFSYLLRRYHSLNSPKISHSNLLSPIYLAYASFLLSVNNLKNVGKLCILA